MEENATVTVGEDMSKKKSRPKGEELERQADEARKKLAEAEHRAEETLKCATEKLEELTEEQEQDAERLRNAAREPTGRVLPPKGASPTDPGEPYPPP
jgi:hypothetical protein